MAAHENPALAGERRRVAFQDGVISAECQNSIQNAIKTLHWDAFGEYASGMARLSEFLDRAAEIRSLETARAIVVCLRDTAKAAIASFNEIGGAL